MKFLNFENLNFENHKFANQNLEKQNFEISNYDPNTYINGEERMMQFGSAPLENSVCKK